MKQHKFKRLPSTTTRHTLNNTIMHDYKQSDITSTAKVKLLKDLKEPAESQSSEVHVASEERGNSKAS